MSKNNNHLPMFHKLDISISPLDKHIKGGSDSPVISSSPGKMNNSSGTESLREIRKKLTQSNAMEFTETYSAAEPGSGLSHTSARSMVKVSSNVNKKHHAQELLAGDESEYSSSSELNYSPPCVQSVLVPGESSPNCFSSLNMDDEAEVPVLDLSSDISLS